MDLLRGIPLLAVNDEVIAVAERIVATGLIPRKAANDAYHLAVSAFHGVDYLLTWNCTHLANAEIIGPIADLIRAIGYSAPTVCTPVELMGG